MIPHYLRRAALVGTTALLATASGAGAQTTSFGQSFTAPTAPNTLLQALHVDPAGLFGTGNNGGFFTAQIFAFDGTSLVGSSLFAEALGSSFSGLDLSPNIMLTPGGTFAVVTVQTGDGSESTTTVGGSYAGGSFISCTGTSCLPILGTRDVAGFSVQFGAATSTVPEPSSMALLGTGLIGLVPVARRRRRA